ncbi:hypothetical protein AN958_01101 [Leucoagaricus sp. SymC.cos]|nr:hypothetical protein AN958_01101 [Leucoagaricus sp. SymC.cos]
MIFDERGTPSGALEKHFYNAGNTRIDFGALHNVSGGEWRRGWVSRLWSLRKV